MTPGEIERTKAEADAAWTALRQAQGVVQRLIDDPAMPRAYREADIREARHHLGAALKAISGARHRLELAALLGDRSLSTPVICHNRRAAKLCPGPLSEAEVMWIVLGRRVPEDMLCDLTESTTANVDVTLITEAGQIAESHTIYPGQA